MPYISAQNNLFTAMIKTAVGVVKSDMIGRFYVGTLPKATPCWSNGRYFNFRSYGHIWYAMTSLLSSCLMVSIIINEKESITTLQIKNSPQMSQCMYFTII